MTSKLGGRPTKDAPISDAFNPVKKLGRQDIAAFRRARDAEQRKEREELALISRKNAKEADEGVDTEKDLDDEKSAYQMLQDLRYGYRNSVGPGGKKGKQRLVELMESDTEFKFVVKELMKIESALMSAKARKNEEPGGIGQQNFFVILKGLEDEKKFLPVGDKTVDMRQITQAINPEENTGYEAEEEVSQRDAPEMLLGRLGGEDGPT